MLKKTITFKNLEDEEITRDFYFNFSKAELAEMELSMNGGFANMLQSIIDAKDVPTIMKVFKDLILRSYGVKSSDGIQFEKSEELSRKFMQTDAYNVLYMELISDAKAAAAFCNGLIPKDLAAEIAKKNSEAADAKN